MSEFRSMLGPRMTGFVTWSCGPCDIGGQLGGQAALDAHLESDDHARAELAFLHRELSSHDGHCVRIRRSIEDLESRLGAATLTPPATSEMS